MSTVVHALSPTDTLMSLSDSHYGAYDGWRVIAEANGIRDWGMATPLVLRAGLDVGDRLVIPSLGGGDR